MYTINARPVAYLQLCFSLCLLAVFLLPAYAASPIKVTQNLTLAKGVDVPLTIFNAAGKEIVLWLPSEYGLVQAEFNAAKELAKAGIEVWLADLHAAYFLPLVPSSMQQIPVADVAQLIDTIRQRTGKTVSLISAGEGAALALSGAAATRGKDPLHGAIFFSPNFYVAIPEPGENVQYVSVASATRISVAIFQPALSPWRWHVDELQTLLEKGGASVNVKMLPGVRDRFYFREDAFPVEQELALTLPQLILTAYKQLGEKRP
jgi:alpha-beta hydrolase superfamily lysophospholipase